MEYKTAFGTIITSTNSETDVSKKEEFNNMKTLKFETMIKEVSNNLGSCSVVNSSGIFSRMPISLCLATKSNAMLSLIFQYNKMSDYAKIVISHSVCSEISDGTWAARYRENDYDYFIDHKNRLNAAKSFISSYSSGESRVKYEFVFWNLMVLAVDKTDFEEKMSLICDFARMLKVTDDEVEDIIQVIKIIFREINAEESTFKTDNIPDMFGKVINMYENKNTCAQKG